MGADFSNIKDLPLGLRQNNPGNVRPLGRGQFWLGQTGTNKGFAVFENISYGIRAIAKNAITQIQKNGRNTIAKYITAYAPPGENDTAGYIRSVSKALGMKPHQKLNLTYPVLHKLIRVHIIKEVGRYGSYITDADITEGILKIKES